MRRSAFARVDEAPLALVADRTDSIDVVELVRGKCGGAPGPAGGANASYPSNVERDERFVSRIDPLRLGGPEPRELRAADKR